MKKFSKVMLLLGLAVAISACSGNKNSEESQQENVLELTGSGSYFKSLFLTITHVDESDSAYVYTVKATHQGDTVGFLLEMNKDIPAGINGDGSVNQDNGFKTGTIKFASSGEESDRFLQALGSIWGVTPNSDTFSAKPVTPLVFSSNQQAFDGSKTGTNNYKLFFDLNAVDPGEWFLTHDTYFRRIELQEKDESFRQVIVNALGGKPTGME